MFYGRTREIAAIGELLARAADGRAGVLVVRGEAGIGKSTLLDRVVAAAGAFRVVRVTGTEAESELPFAGLHLLLGKERGRLRVLPDAQADALRAALDSGDARPGNRFLLGAATLTLLAEIAENQPLLCLVDDAQWLDRASLDALLFAARRLDAERLVLAIAVRDIQLPELGLLDATELVLPGLDENDAAALLAGESDTLSTAATQWVMREARGNPLALHVFAHLPSPEQMYSSPYGRPDGAPPHRIQRAFTKRIAQLPRATRDFMLVMAADDSGEAAVICAATAELGVGEDAADQAERAGLVSRSDGRLTFRHPLIRAAAYQGAAPVRRRAAHRALATALAADASAADRRAWQLAAAASGPDEAAAAALEQAAGHAKARGGLVEMVAAYRRAAALTPDPARRGLRLSAGAQAAYDAGDLDHASMLADQAVALTHDPSAQAALTGLRAAIVLDRDEPRVAMLTLRTAAVLVAGQDPVLAGALALQAAQSAWAAGDLAAVAETADQAERLGVPGAARVRALANLVIALNPGSRDAGQAFGLLRWLLAGLDPDRLRERALITHWHLLLGDISGTRDLASALEDDCRREGALGVLARALMMLARAEFLLGHHARAATAAAEGLRLAAETGQWAIHVYQSTTLALLAAVRGDEQACHELTAEPLARGIAPSSTHASAALSLLDLGAGRPEAAFDRLVTVLAGPNRQGAMAGLPDLIEAAHRIGRPEEAREALDWYAQWAEHLDQPSALAVAHRCRALLSADAEAEGHYLAALESHYRSVDFAFDRARTELLYGEWLRRAQRRADARRHLRAAMESFQQVDATVWADRARAELRATGETRLVDAGPSPLRRLTPQELQTVQLAADGLSNKDIAAKLFLSPRTIGYHLSNAYAKLGVTSRRELAALSASV